MTADIRVAVTILVKSPPRHLGGGLRVSGERTSPVLAVRGVTHVTRTPECRYSRTNVGSQLVSDGPGNGSVFVRCERHARATRVGHSLRRPAGRDESRSHLHNRRGIYKAMESLPVSNKSLRHKR